MISTIYVPKRRGSSRRLYAVGLALIVITIAAAAVSILDLRRNAIENYRQNMANLGVLLAEHLSRSMQAVDLVLGEMRQYATQAGVRTPEDFTALLKERVTHDFLIDRVKHLPQAAALTLTGADGRIVNVSRFWPPPDVDLTDRDYFIAARDKPDGAMIIGAPARSRVTGDWTLFVARRVTGAGGDFLGIVQAVVELRYFEDFYKAITLMDGASVTVLRRDGMMVARHPPTEKMMGKYMPAESPWYDRVMRLGGNYQSPGYLDGIVREVGVHPLTDYPLVIDVTVPVATALEHWRRQTMFIGIATLGAVFGFAVLFRSLAAHVGRLERSERALSEALVEIGQASRAKSDFLAHMSHELRTPLNAIIGFSEVMTAGLFGPLGSPRYEEYAKDIHRSGRYLHELISDMLDMAKIEAGRHELHLAELDCRHEIGDALRMIGQRAEAQHVSTELQTVDPPTLLGDRRAFKQIMLNLLGNAVKFTRPGGKVTVRVARAGRDVTVAIIDTGIGIAADKLEKLGTPFFRVEDPGYAGTEGTGLGLALTKSLVKLHGWHLEIASEVGRGTTVTIIMPDAAARSATPRQPAEAAA